MKLIIGFLTLLVLCAYNTSHAEQTKDPAALVALLSNPDQKIRAGAAATLRRLIVTNPSSKSNDHSEKYWKKQVDAIMIGMKHSDVIKLLPAYDKTLSADRLLNSGSRIEYGHKASWRLDHYWIVKIRYYNPDMVMKRPTLEKKAMRVWVKPPEGFTGTWVSWYVNGFKDHVIEYKNGKYDGAFIVFYDNGQKNRQQHYKAGVGASGLGSGWYPDGSKMYHINYADGKQAGTLTHWFPDGNLRSRCEYKDGKRHGTWSSWCKDGKMQREVSYQNGKKHGLDREWDKNGQLLWSRYFENGRLKRNDYTGKAQIQAQAQVQTQGNIPETLKDMLYVNMFGRNYTTQHPLICIKGGDYPRGSEIIFIKQSNPKEWVHAVFPKRTVVPKNRTKKVVLHGYFQNVQNIDSYKRKRVSDDYEYFVVTSWEYQK